MEINWICKKFKELTIDELYDIIEARMEVFVVEQECVYQDLDGHVDKISDHIFCYNEDGILAAYARVVPKGTTFPELAIGRIITTKVARGTGMGAKLMHRCYEYIDAVFGNQDIRIGAQQYAIPFYEGVGFEVVKGTEYIEDDIPHVEMIKKA